MHVTGEHRFNRTEKTYIKTSHNYFVINVTTGINGIHGDWLEKTDGERTLLIVTRPSPDYHAREKTSDAKLLLQQNSISKGIS